MSERIKSENFRASELEESLETIKAKPSLYFPDGEAAAQNADVSSLVLYERAVAELGTEPQQVCILCCPITTGIERANAFTLKITY